MSFASPTFLWYFMPAVLALYLLLPPSRRNALVAVASLAFYTWGAGSYVLLLVVVMLVNWVVGLALESDWTWVKRRRRARALLLTALGVDLGVLLGWKYTAFAFDQLGVVSDVLGGPKVPYISVLLPLGVSFYVFHNISYVVDVYRRVRPPQRSLVDHTTYITMFPQLVAGPIVRYHEISEQLSDRRQDRLDDIAAGFPRFALGLAKKVVLADAIAPVVDATFTTDPSQLTTATAWFGAAAYALQIYFDFSGYTDMAIGLARMFGFRLPENFNLPYHAVSVTDFWRRWHMSLSRWFRDYVYVPLGGNRAGAGRTYLNLYIVFALTGLWHGADWAFLVWGLYHGTLLVAERLTGVARLGADVAPGWRRAATLLLVVVGWVPFRAGSLEVAWPMLRAMVVWTPGWLPAPVVEAVTTRRLLVLLVAAAVVLVPRRLPTGWMLERRDDIAAAWTRLGVSTVGVSAAAVLVAAGTFSPFLYFRF